ncbi:helix-turn-helix transcriptional regulator [Spiractinospora alimapuensis]|uniref:helix-turn-helix domain-containing protein n=1 Tax=Spiractinospora alimapuensis TaxID=2820884 RepID=UPI001F346E95|nr:helix-turn-helix transcriptional regulator [Spiractinospora alimapuensis]QVQ54123.1 helix-turn-helix transcriptional regulator [Spiractinospora alimapuensis]
MDHLQKEINVRLGREISRLRRYSRYTQSRLAAEVGVSQTHIGNIERGERTPDVRLVADIDSALNAKGRLDKLWATLSGDGEPVWLDDLAQIEREAVSVMECHNALFPALLQTEAYAEVVTQCTSPWATGEEIRSTVQGRMKRATWFAESTTPSYRVVLDHSVITRTVGKAATSANQLAHVIALIERRRISAQLVAQGCHPGLGGPFALIASPTAPDVVYVESADAGRMVDDPVRVQQFRLLFSDIQAVALSPEESLQRMRDELEKVTHD